MSRVGAERKPSLLLFIGKDLVEAVKEKRARVQTKIKKLLTKPASKTVMPGHGPLDDPNHPCKLLDDSEPEEVGLDADPIDEEVSVGDPVTVKVKHDKKLGWVLGKKRINNRLKVKVVLENVFNGIEMQVDEKQILGHRKGLSVFLIKTTAFFSTGKFSVVKTMTDEQVKIADQIRNVDPNTAIKMPTPIQNTDLSHHDVAKLSDKQWLNGEIINFYLNLLQLHHADVYVFPSQHFESMQEHGLKHRGVKHRCRGTDIFTKRLLLAPIHHNKHWTLQSTLFEDPSKPEVTYLNSISPANTSGVTQDHLDNILWLRFLQG